MLPLIKIRMKLFKTKQFCFCSCLYIFILVFSTFFLLLGAIFQENIPMKIYNNTVLNDVNLLSIDNYSKLQTYLKRTSLIVNDADI